METVFILNEKKLRGATHEDGGFIEFRPLVTFGKMPLYPGAKFILFRETGGEEAGIFKNYGIVVSVDVLDSWGQEYAEEEKRMKENGLIWDESKAGKELFLVKIKSDSDIPNHPTLDSLKYSLRFVRNFTRPESHLIRSIRKIDHEDFETIVNRRYYYSRTAFAHLISALHPAHQKQFAYQALEKLQTTVSYGIDYQAALHILKDYIDEIIISRGKLLVSIKSMLEAKFSDLMEIGKVGLVNDETLKSDRLMIQGSYFELFFAEEAKSQFWDSLFYRIRDNEENEEALRKVFSKISWPIDITYGLS